MLYRQFLQVRARTVALCDGLQLEDYVIQSMPDASPLKWHLAHSTWFFETFVLAKRSGHKPFDRRYDFLFNSYYDAVGHRWARCDRGLLSRPTVDEVLRYRNHVDASMKDACQQNELADVITLGLHHEQQHQELMLTDLKHAFSLNPLGPVYRRSLKSATTTVPALEWCAFAGGTVAMGAGPDGFAFDNERPRHDVLLRPFRIATRLVTAGEYAAFVGDGGYRRPELWLSDGWATVAQSQAPLYWRRESDGWALFTLAGWRRLRDDAPICHVSFYEADAYARWAGARLPSEHEWEHAAASADAGGDHGFIETGTLHPEPTRQTGLTQMLGECWQWTQSAYSPYPGYRPLPGALGEYNGKFMCNQMVLRGASCFTARSHARLTYRNFFPPSARWQMSGIRLATDG